MIKVAVAGLGKMGLSHLAMIRPHPDVELVGVCDGHGYMLDVLQKNTGVVTFSDYERMLDESKPDAVIIATPSHLHGSMVRAAIERDIHIFCEKPLFLDPVEGQELTQLAESRGLVTQVGYHNKFVGAFQEVKKLLELGAIGPVTDVLAEAYGPVVLKPAGRSWRSSKTTGGGCLYDYAAHPIDLLTWYFGNPETVRGSELISIFSKEIDDAVASTIVFEGGPVAQLHTNWSDESQRKMTTRISIWGEGGKIYADRQEIQVYLRDTVQPPPGYVEGWNVKYTTELTPAPYFYLRGEEYSAQLDEFVQRVQRKDLKGPNTFESASVTDRTIAMIAADAEGTLGHERVVRIDAAPGLGSAAAQFGNALVQKGRESAAAAKTKLAERKATR